MDEGKWVVGWDDKRWTQDGGVGLEAEHDHSLPRAVAGEGLTLYRRQAFELALTIQQTRHATAILFPPPSTDRSIAHGPMVESFRAIVDLS